MQAKFVFVGIVKSQSSEVVLDLTSQAIGDALQDALEIEVGNDRIVDVEQDSCAV